MDHNRENTNHTIPWTSSHTSSGSVFRVDFGGPNTEPQEAFGWNSPFKSGKTLMPNPSLGKQQTSEWTQAHDQLPSFRDPNRSAKFEVTFRPGGPHLKPTDPSSPKKMNAENRENLSQTLNVYGIFTYIYHKKLTIHVGKYTSHIERLW